MFYLKYRPKTINEIDNSKVQEEVGKLLQSKKLPHALLFIGQKGTGKTSTARVFAKSINCLKNKFSGNGSQLEPCNDCENCNNIDKSSSVDVIEMDAASNRGIDEIRNLIKETSFLPMNNRYRVFIIDEAHMITSDAFNALLKTLEEPPDSVIFILATTNLEKLPKTIVSRCFLINFGKAKKTDIIHMLKRISKNEKLNIDEKLLQLISSHSEHSFRDATKILEELVIQDKLSFEEGRIFLGILGKENLLEVIHKKNLKSSLSWIEEFSNAGGNFKHLIEELLEESRKLLLAKNSIDIDDDVLKIDFSLSELSFLIKLLTEAYNNLKISPVESLPLEIAVVDFYNNREKN